ncbi:DUF1800 family protein [Ralstonia sp. SET104]|uniref:DUF1800 domain-containing protein n=1 Tax=Ralstonia sp. SET104 TaxID=2448774 RepID=UPI000F563305|nr:DUF1800 family protein [Ralstonia sp. SET104]GCB04566.1 hypothetical protein PSUB009319_21970 [Ralstonia sp. SET104]
MRIRSTTIFLALAAAGALSVSLQSAHAATQDKPHRHTTQAKAPAADEQRLDRDDARYFLTRIGFAPSESELDAYAGLTHREAVDRALAQTGTVATQAPPAWVNDPIVPYNKLPDEDARKAARQKNAAHELELRAWWMGEMIKTPSPLTERMTLFWHNHFVSSSQKVPFAQLMYRQNALLRQNAVGNFGTMLHAIGKDPAMLIYLDGAESRKGKPNENFAREVMELFTLGEGHYTEQDIKEAARTYTGWSIDREHDFAYVWRPQIHDAGTKTVFGQSGDYDGDQMLDILLSRPETATFIVTKLWREFVSADVDVAQEQRVADAFRASGYDIKVALRGLFLTPAFWAPQSHATLVKSPVEMIVGTLKQFNVQYTDPTPFAIKSAQLGQNLLAPPNVKGWPGGDAWINSTTLLGRKQFLDQLFRSTEMKAPSARAQQQQKPGMMMTAMREDLKQGGNVQGLGQALKGMGQEGRFKLAQSQTMVSFNSAKWLAQFGADGDEPPQLAPRISIQRAVLPIEPTAPIPVKLAGTAYLRTLMMDPAYQLK